MAHFRTWHDLILGNNGGYDESSKPHNPACKLGDKSCSTELKTDDICYWHYYRKCNNDGFETMNCNCKNTFQIVKGDIISRQLAKSYHDLKQTCIEEISLTKKNKANKNKKLYCCEKSACAKAERFLCGDLSVGFCCKNLHDTNNLIPVKNNSGYYTNYEYDSD